MKYLLEATLDDFDGAFKDLKEEFEAKDWKEAEEKGLDIYLSYHGDYNSSSYSITNVSTNEIREYDEEINVSQEKINRINAILANAYPDEFNEVG